MEEFRVERSNNLNRSLLTVHIYYKNRSCCAMNVWNSADRIFVSYTPFITTYVEGVHNLDGIIACVKHNIIWNRKVINF